jgi:hypothetical protein
MSVVAAGIGAAISIGGSIFGSSSARRAKRRAARKARRLEGKLRQMEANRQKIINPYAGVTSLSNMLSNPFDKLTVATKATEIQMEQTDLALANTLDTLMATGASAGGATALAQAALQSKKGVAANIESQEVANDARRAQGEATLMQQKKSEAQRMQASDVAGKQFVYGETEKRETTAMNRVSNQIAALRGQEAQAQADQTAAITGGIGAIAGIAGGLGGKI